MQCHVSGCRQRRQSQVLYAVQYTHCSVDDTHLILYPGGLPRLDTTRLSLNGVSGTEYASPGHAHPRHPYLAALSSHFTNSSSPLHVDLRNRHTTLPWRLLGLSQGDQVALHTARMHSKHRLIWKVEAWMDKNVPVPDRDPSSDGDETGKGEVEWDNVSADVMRRIIWRMPRYLQHFDPVSVTIIIRVPTYPRKGDLRYQ